MLTTLGNVTGQPLLDWAFVNTGSFASGPFSSVSQFHDWFTTAYGPNRLEPWEERSPHPYRCHLRDDVPIVFTHADLHPSNVILAPRETKDDRPRIAAVIDWQQAGWYPGYWEYCKSRWAWSAKVGGAWKETYLPLIMEASPYEGDCYDYWDHFVLARNMTTIPVTFEMLFYWGAPSGFSGSLLAVLLVGTGGAGGRGLVGAEDGTDVVVVGGGLKYV